MTNRGTSKKSNSTAFNIDSNKLLLIINYSGGTKAKVSRAMGYCDSALSYALRKGTMTVDMADRLEEVLKIKRSDYEIIDSSYDKSNDIKSDVEPVTSNVNFELSEEMENKFYKIIYSAVYAAVKQVWSE